MSYENARCPHCGDIPQITHREGVTVYRCINRTCQGSERWLTSEEWEAYRALIMPKVEPEPMRKKPEPKPHFSNATMRVPVPGKPHIAFIDGFWRVSPSKFANKDRWRKAHYFVNLLNKDRLALR